MNRTLQLLKIFLVCGLAAGFSCQRDNLPEPLPGMTILVTPATGQTTENFSMEARSLSELKENNTLYFRWDWDGDGTWDTRFSSGNVVKHRFCRPGTYQVRLETADGKKQVRTDSMKLVVSQGYSAPHAAFTVNPEKGNYTTEFLFDAGSTRDDEDSLDQLKFRWDFEGKGYFSTPYSSEPIARYKYARTGIFIPKLEVTDPSGKAATFTRQVQITLEDTLIRAEFTVSSDLIRVNDTVILDASGSTYTVDTTHPLRYSWLLPERVEWTTPEEYPVRELVLRQKGTVTVQLKVLDEKTSFFNTTERELLVAEEDRPPVARIQAGSAQGNILTQFYFDSWLSTDDNQSPSELAARWDFNGDGNWDNSYSLEKTVYHQYDQPGEYMVYLQVRDKENQTGIDKISITVSANTNTTGFFRDPRDGQFYGTVTLGSQTWMSRNLSYTIPQKEREGLYQWICLNEQSKWCDLVGKLYRIGAVIENRGDEDFVTVCPTGWRIPTQQDWEALIQTLGGEKNIKELRSGGKADFNGLDLGYGDYYFVTSGWQVTDTVYFFNETFKTMRFFSSTEPYDINNARTDVWMMYVDRDSGEPWVGYGPTRRYMPVRCVKE